jgi:hypothetical protein
MDKGKLDRAVCVLIGPAFLLLGLYFYFGDKPVIFPVGQAAPIEDAQISSAAIRKPLSDPPLAIINHFQRDCQDCHQIFAAERIFTVQPRHHEDVFMDHGMNVYCISCHHLEDRNLLVLDGGRATTYNQVDQLCAKCHGPAFRDWQKGMHGKTMDFWRQDVGMPRRLGCTECHDPHAPAFAPMAALPGPHTLRMGKPQHSSEHVRIKNPLRRWSSTETAPDVDNPAQEDHQ